MVKVSSTDFQNAVGKYLALLEKEPIIITKNGRSVAKVTAYTDPSDLFISEAKREYGVRSQASYKDYLDLTIALSQSYLKDVEHSFLYRSRLVVPLTRLQALQLLK